MPPDPPTAGPVPERPAMIRCSGDGPVRTTALTEQEGSLTAWAEVSPNRPSYRNLAAIIRRLDAEVCRLSRKDPEP